MILEYQFLSLASSLLWFLLHNWNIVGTSWDTLLITLIRFLMFRWSREAQKIYQRRRYSFSVPSRSHLLLRPNGFIQGSILIHYTLLIYYRIVIYYRDLLYIDDAIWTVSHMQLSIINDPIIFPLGWKGVPLTLLEYKGSP